MYLSDEEYKIVKQALGDAEEMQKKYEETLDYIEKYIEILADVIIDNNLCEKVMERCNDLKDVEIKRRFHRKDTFVATVKDLVKVKV